jgi:hypothetical protein
MSDRSDRYGDRTDRELIRLILNDPNSAESKGANAEFEYRKHLSIKRHNSWLLILTIILASSAIAQVLVNIIVK